MGGQLRLKDGVLWEISAGEPETHTLVSIFEDVMRLSPVQAPTRRLLVVGENAGIHPSVTAAAGEEALICALTSPEREDIALTLQLRQIALHLSYQVQLRGGILLHAALAEWKGRGVLLAGRAGIGKSTASRKLTLPWQSLSDDLSLIVRDAEGEFWAHPWPTWSRFLPGRGGGSWNVQHAVPLKGLFFLNQASELRLEALGTGHAAGLLNSAWKQARCGLPLGLADDEVTAIRQQGFDTVCRLARRLHGYILHLRLDSFFQQEIEHVLEQ